MSATGPSACAYCLTDVAADDAQRCGECGAHFHPECWAEYGGCTVFGCAGWLANQMVATTQPRQLAAPAGFAPPQAPAPPPGLRAAAAALPSPAGLPPPVVAPEPPPITDSQRDVETPPAGIRRPIGAPLTSNEDWWNT